MEAAVHLVGIIREFPRRGVTFERLHVTATRHVLAAANAAGVTRYLHMSALGARAEAPSPYHRTKWQAEELVRGSRLAWTIFRPSVIFGPGDGLVSLLAGIVGRAPVVPVIGDGQYLLQPVSVTSVAEGFALALERPETIGKTYEAGGPDRLPYERILDLIAASLGRTRPRKLHLPVAPVRAAAKLLGRFSWFPLTADQLTMLLEGNTCDPEPFHRDLGLTPRPFAGRACSQAPAPRQV
jgi:NADH dehydrogenase